MAEASPAAAKSVGSPLKKIPTPVLIAGGGAVIGIGYAVLRDRMSPPTVVEGTGAGSVQPSPQYDSGSAYIPQSVAYTGPSVDSSAGMEAVGSIGTTALNTIGEIFGALVPAFVEHKGVDPNLAAVLGAMPAGGGAPAAQAAPVVVQVPAPTPATPAPAANPDPLRYGYNAGGNIREGTINKVFPGAIGWARVGSGGGGKDHFVDYHVQYPGRRINRYRCYPNRSGQPWSTIWSGTW